MTEGYRGLFGAFVYAFRRSSSWLLRSYVATSVIVGAYAAALLALALVSWLATPMAFGDRAFLVVIGLFVLVPLFAPVLIVARRHRRAGGAVGRRGDALLALAGYAFVASVYLALLVTDPTEHAAAGALGAALALVDRVPAGYGLVPPVVAAALVALAAWLTGPGANG